jgi:hypothetical protein
MQICVTRPQCINFMESNWCVMLKMCSTSCARFLKPCWSQKSGLCCLSCEIVVFARLCCTYVEVTLLNNFVHITVSLVVFVSFASFCPYCIHLSVYHCTTNPWPCLSLLPHSVHTVSNYRFIIALPTHGHVCLFCLILSILSTYRCIIALPTHGHVCLFCLTLPILYPSIHVSLHYQPMAMQQL